MTSILIVDDSRIARKRISIAIQESEVSCNILDEAIDGEDGLQKFLQLRPDIVITDMEMPKLNGEQLIQKIRRIKANIPIIVVTSIINTNMKQTLMANGSIYILHKPIDNKLFKILFKKIIKNLDKIKKEI